MRIFHHFDQKLIPRIVLVKINVAKNSFISINRTFSRAHARSRLLVNLSLFSLSLPLYPSPHSHLFACCKEISIFWSLYKCETCIKRRLFFPKDTLIKVFHVTRSLQYLDFYLIFRLYTDNSREVRDHLTLHWRIYITGVNEALNFPTDLWQKIESYINSMRGVNLNWAIQARVRLHKWDIAAASIPKHQL